MRRYFFYCQIVIFFFSCINAETSKKENKSQNSTNIIKSESCEGSQNCIENVRVQFSNTNKQILGEEYLGGGKFGISFLDSQRGEAFNAKVYTNCNCEIINVDISRIN